MPRAEKRGNRDVEARLRLRDLVNGKAKEVEAKTETNIKAEEEAKAPQQGLGPPSAQTAGGTVSSYTALGSAFTTMGASSGTPELGSAFLARQCRQPTCAWQDPRPLLS